MNRVQKSINAMREQIAHRITLGLTTEAAVERTRKALDMTAEEHARFQELKSLASMSGTLTLEEAQLVFTLLGGTPSHFNGQDAATKAVLTRLFEELLRAQVA